jgi:hypothetical protein
MATFDYEVVITGSGFGGSVCRASCRGEGLPGWRPGVRQALEGRGHSEDPVGSAELLVAPRGRAVRDPKDRVSRRCAHPPKKLDSHEGAVLFEVINRNASAHFIGGIPIGDSSESGAVDPYLRLFGQPGLHVIDGSVMPANPGVNPSLMITALAERAMSLWPNRGEADARPPLGSGYERVNPVMPHRPVVPAGAQGELRLDAKAADVIPEYPRVAVTGRQGGRWPPMAHAGCTVCKTISPSRTRNISTPFSARDPAAFAVHSRNSRSQRPRTRGHPEPRRDRPRGAVRQPQARRRGDHLRPGKVAGVPGRREATDDAQRR